MDNVISASRELATDWGNTTRTTENSLQAIYVRLFGILSLFTEAFATVTNFAEMWDHDLFKMHFIDVCSSSGFDLPCCDNARIYMYASVAFDAIRDWFPEGYSFIRSNHGMPIATMAQSSFCMEVLVTLILMHFLWLKDVKGLSRDSAKSAAIKAYKNIMVKHNIIGKKTPDSQEEAERFVSKLSEWLVEQGVDFPEVRLSFISYFFPDFHHCMLNLTFMLTLTSMSTFALTLTYVLTLTFMLTVN